MKRRQFLKTAGVGLAGAAIAKPAIAQSSPTLKWRLTASWPKSLDTLWGACETIAKYVSEAVAASDLPAGLGNMLSGAHTPGDPTAGRIFKGMGETLTG